MVKNSRAYHWGKSKTNTLLKIDFIRFGMVGAIGFVVTATLLNIFHIKLGLDILPATLLSSEGGLLSNYFFHEKWTYKHVENQEKSLWKKCLRFHMSSWSGLAIITIVESLSVRKFHLNYLVALILASAITMFWNFFWTKYYIFKGHTPAALLEPEDTVPERN